MPLLWKQLQFKEERESMGQDGAAAQGPSASGEPLQAPLSGYPWSKDPPPTPLPSCPIETPSG